MSILLSIHPERCEKILRGKKTIEVRKTKPNIQTPFKCYMYCTKGKKIFYQSRYTNDFIVYKPSFYEDTKILLQQNGYKVFNGKVIGEFVVDEVEPKYCANGIAVYYENEQGTCLSDNELRMYADGVKPLYFWHITDAKLYDKPRELVEFFAACKQPKGTDCSVCRENREYTCKSLTRPPQSFCYVEEVAI